MSQARINWEGCDRKGIRRKNGDDGGGGFDGPDGVASSQIVGALASTIFPTPFKIQNDVFWYWPTWVVPDKGS